MGTHSDYSREQINRYRDGALVAKALALPCNDPDLRDAYLSIAKSWMDLADKIERRLATSE